MCHISSGDIPRPNTKMRVIAGKSKGLSLKYPKGPQIRPTADMVREAIFSALESASTDWTRILDLYAGTGALGIEALSRGAEEADFVEKNPKCCAAIRENLENTGFTHKSNVYRLDVSKALRTLNKRYSLIFLDPPYADKSATDTLANITGSNLVENQTTIVMEHSERLKPEENYGAFRMTNKLHHGDTCVSIFRSGGSEN